MRHRGLWLVLCLCAVPGVAAAQTASDPIAARALFDDARSLAQKGQYEQACPKFEESQKLDPGIGTVFNWADCLEHVGRTASAWIRFLDAAQLAKASGQPDREKVARDRADALAPKLSKLAIEVKSIDAGLEVSRDKVAVGKGLWGTAVPVDPGEHVVEAKAPSKKPWKQSVQVAANAARIVVTVPALESEDAAAAAALPTAPAVAPAPTPVAAPPPVPVEAPAPTPAPVSADVGTGGSSQKTIGIVVGAVGVVGLVVGGVFAAQSKSKNDAALGICVDTPDACPDADVATHDQDVSDAKSAKTMSIVGFALGGAALVGGAVLYFTAPKSKTALRVQPLVGARGATVMVGGAF